LLLAIETSASLFDFVIICVSFVPTEMFNTAGGDKERSSRTGGNQTTSQIRLNFVMEFIYKKLN
jgi:hypothetical protein